MGAGASAGAKREFAIVKKLVKENEEDHEICQRDLGVAKQELAVQVLVCAPPLRRGYTMHSAH